MSNFDSLLDSSIDDLADIPEFKTFPNGIHKVTVNFKEKEVNKHPCVEFNMSAVETVELSNPADSEPLNEGDEGSVLYMLDNEIGQGKLKKILSVFAQQFGTSSLRETMEAANGCEVLVVSKQRVDKKNGNVYNDVARVYFE